MTMTAPNSHAASSGFTLLELLVAMALFALMSALAYGGLSSTTRAVESVERAGKDLAKLQMAFTIIARDLGQTVARGIRDDFGDPQPAMVGGSEGIGRLLEFTRAGWRNPTGRPRSYLERVAYGIDDDKLVRLSWGVLDRAQGAEPREMILFEGVKELKLRFFDPQRAWKTEWPPLVIGDAPQIPLPRAVEVTVELEGWGEIVRLFRTAGESLPAAQDDNQGA